MYIIHKQALGPNERTLIHCFCSSLVLAHSTSDFCFKLTTLIAFSAPAITEESADTDWE